MAKMQWLGSVPAKKTGWSYLADAMKGGVEAGVGAYERGKERELKLEQIDYGKKRDVANMVIDAASNMDKESASQLLESEEVKGLFDDLGWPIPKGISDEDMKDEAIKAVSEGKTLPGMTEEETKKAAGILVKPRKVSGKAVEEAKEAVPWWQQLPFSSEKTGEEEATYYDLKKKYIEQYLGEGKSKSTSSDPLGVR